ncbi:hypothetical protein ES703_07683 [subsurface metagenome]
MKYLRQACRTYSGLLLAGAVLFQVSFLHAQAIPIAIVEFEGNGISQTEAIALTDRLRNELFRLGAFEVVERGMMETILNEQDFQLTGCTSNECLVEVGQLLGARQVVGGRISRVGAMFTVSARVVDVQTGKLLGVSDFDLRGGLEEMLTDGMKQVAVMLSGDEVAATVAVNRPDIREPSHPAGEGVGAQRPRTWSISVGMGSSKCANVISISKDLIVWHNLSIFFNAGFPAYVGGGFAYQRHYNQKGLALSISLGIGDGWEVVNTLIAHQWALGRRGFFIAGLAAIGINYGYYVDEDLYPVLSYEFRF